jgi:hypothetical protein
MMERQSRELALLFRATHEVADFMKRESQGKTIGRAARLPG